MKAYKTSEIAKILGCSVPTVISEIERGRLKAFKVGAENRVTEQALQDYMGVIANGYKTENEVRLEKENAELKEKLEKALNKLMNISAVITGIAQ